MDGLPLCQMHDRVIRKWINLLSKQDPVVLRQVLQHQPFFVSSLVCLGKSRVQRRTRKRRSRDLPVFRWSRHDGEV